MDSSRAIREVRIMGKSNVFYYGQLLEFEQRVGFLAHVPE